MVNKITWTIVSKEVSNRGFKTVLTLPRKRSRLFFNSAVFLRVTERKLNQLGFVFKLLNQKCLKSNIAFIGYDPTLSVGSSDDKRFSFSSRIYYFRTYYIILSYYHVPTRSTKILKSHSLCYTYNTTLNGPRIIIYTFRCIQCDYAYNITYVI